MGFFNFAPSFRGGTHPPGKKSATVSRQVKPIPLPSTLYLPLNQHAGAMAEPVVKKGESVVRGQLLAEPAGEISAALHSPAGGEIKKITPHLTPCGQRVPTIVLSVDPKNTETNFYQPYENLQKITPRQIKERVKQAGIVGLGGGAFPTSVKLSPPADKPIHTVILNGCECESFLTSDHRMMVERPDQIIQGLQLLIRAVEAERGIIGVENNKPDAIKILKQKLANNDRITVQAVRAKYPQGVENMLIYALTGKKISAREYPVDKGFLVNNVSTAAAVSEAVFQGKPLIERIITLSGPGLKKPGNFLVPLGTSFKELISHCEPDEDFSLVLAGGAMMGTSQADLSAPTVKATGGVVVLDSRYLQTTDEHPCIRCGRCVTGCPQQLVPTKLTRLIKSHRFSEAKQLHVDSCLECGVCSYVCPSSIPLVHWLRVGKNREINE